MILTPKCLDAIVQVSAGDPIELTQFRDRADVGWLLVTRQASVRGSDRRVEHHFVVSPMGRAWRVTDRPSPNDCDPYWVGTMPYTEAIR